MLCRLCLKVSECCLEIFDSNGQKLGIADILQRHFWFQPQPTDTISTVICVICWLKVNDFHQFYMAVEQAHSILSNAEMKHETVSVVVAGSGTDECSNTEEMKEEYLELQHSTEEEIVDENIVNPLYEAEFENNYEGSTQGEDIDKEFENNCEGSTQVEDIDKEFENNCEGSTQVEDIDKEEVDEKKAARPRKRVKVNSASKKETAPKRKRERRKTTKTTKKQSENILEEDEDNDGNDDGGDDGSVKRKFVMAVNSLAEDDAMVKKHIAMGCDICTFVGGDFPEICKHFRLQHAPMKPYIRCCNRKLDKRTKIVQHAYKHEDPNFFRCIECAKVFANRFTLNYHMVERHGPREKLRFACDQCPKKFARKHFLEMHRPTHMPKEQRPFSCDQCPNSRFGTTMLLERHMASRHRRAANVCYVCAKEIRQKAAFEKHVRLHFEDSGPRVKCPRPDCDRWLKDEENLRAHLNRHNDGAIIFKCEECGRISKNRRALRSHILFVHPKKLFTCEECKKTFKKPIALKEHMARHAGESLYKCPFCTRTFTSSANMHNHKKKAHPVEWDNWRKTKQGSSQQFISKQEISF